MFIKAKSEVETEIQSDVTMPDSKGLVLSTKEHEYPPAMDKEDRTYVHNQGRK